MTSVAYVAETDGSALFVVNVVEALITDHFATWMRVQMVSVALLMAVIVLVATRAPAIPH